MTTAFQLADEIVDAYCAVDPVLATSLGVPGWDHLWGDFGLEGVEAERGIREKYRPGIAAFLDAPEVAERLAARVMVGAMDEAESAYQAGDHFRDLSHMASPFQTFRRILDLMSAETEEQRAAIVSRLELLGRALTEYRGLLETGISRGEVVARRQVASVIAQARRIAEDPATLAEVASKAGGDDADRVDAAAASARAAYGEFADWLESAYLPRAVEEDGVGTERYARAAERLVGMPIDPDEAYAWGWEEFARLRAEMDRVADLILADAGWEAVKDHLETDPAETVRGTDALLDLARTVLDAAVEELSDRHFEVPERIRPLTVQLAPPGSPLGVYYMRPSEDFARPGGVWYSIGTQEVFPVYQHVSTAYHEGFPGHHLQIATAMNQADRISRFQRVLTWYPGYAEGWGMYAEVLMGELGYLDDPRHYFGMLAKQMYRTVRVIVDIGLHLGKPIPADSPFEPDGRWSFDPAVEFVRVYGFRTPDQARDEVLRYLGWPGQAIAYKLGEREILAIRQENRQRLGDRFDLKAFHSTILEHGTMRLDLLRDFVRERLPG